MEHQKRHKSCSPPGMDDFAEAASKAVAGESPPPDLERECETWEWARAAGVSAQELRRAVQESMSGRKAG